MLPRILVLSLRKRLIDHIDPRKIHRVPASRLGGVAFYPAIFFAVNICVVMVNILSPEGCKIEDSNVLSLESLALLSLFLIGIYDDILGVSYRNKFFVQIFASVLIMMSGVYFKTLNGFFGVHEIPDWLGVTLTLGFYIFVTNAINLIDGIDGLASSLSMMALGVYGVLLFDGGLIVEALIAVAALGALLPFWYGNVFGVRRGIQSKIFMGDTGALVIGALLGFTAVVVWNKPFVDGVYSSLDAQYSTLAFTMLLILCFDVMRIVVHRYLDKKPLFLPDRNHIHHKFIAVGYSPRRSLLCIMLMNALFLVVNLSLSFFIGFTYIVFIDLFVWTLIHIMLSKRIKQLVSR